MSFALVDVAGVAHALDDTTGVHVAAGTRGLGMPTTTVAGDKLPYAPGAALRRISTPPSILEIPLYLEASTSALLDALLDTLRAWLIPGTERRARPRTVRLRVTRDDGAVREIEGVYAGGLEGDDLAGVEVWQDAVLSLSCPDPYWRDTADTTVAFTSGAGTRSWFPLYPYDLMPSGLFSEQVVTNGGQVEAWPVWVVTGPGSDPRLENLTTGEALVFSGLTLADGDTMTIDTNESAKSVVNQDGANLWRYVPASSVMWPLEVGGNSVRISMDNTTLDSGIALSYRRRWAGGHR